MALAGAAWLGESSPSLPGAATGGGARSGPAYVGFGLSVTLSGTSTGAAERRAARSAREASCEGALGEETIVRILMVEW